MTSVAPLLVLLAMMASRPRDADLPRLALTPTGKQQILTQHATYPVAVLACFPVLPFYLGHSAFAKGREGAVGAAKADLQNV